MINLPSSNFKQPKSITEWRSAFFLMSIKPCQHQPDILSIIYKNLNLKMIKNVFFLAKKANLKNANNSIKSTKNIVILKS